MSINATPRLLYFKPIASICLSCRFRLQKQQYRQVRRAATIAAAPTKDSPSPARPPPPPQILSNTSGQSADDLAKAIPRWARTPPAMKAPYRTTPKNDNDYYPVNEDPAKLDAMYIKLLGTDGDKILTDEVKWLCVTHKSFDQGRRGFNERLAFLGRKIIDLQCSLGLLSQPESFMAIAARTKPDEYGRLPFHHASLTSLENVQAQVKQNILDRKRVAALASRYGVDGVVRWKPRQVQDLQTSGVDGVLRDTLYAIVGAIALQKGGDLAVQITREKILQPLGIT